MEQYRRNFFMKKQKKSSTGGIICVVSLIGIFLIAIAATIMIFLYGPCNSNQSKKVAKASKNTQSKAVTQPDSQGETQSQAETETETETQSETEENSQYVIVIDPGHQRHSNRDLEPLGPGSSEMKKKVSSGTKGCVTDAWEYELNLTVSLMVRDALEEKGYTVIMTRTTHDVDISNVERAKIANEANADAFIRIHANGVDDSSKVGAFTICQTKENPYNGDLYSKSRSLSECVLDGFIESTGATREDIWETDTMTGINWCEVPVTILEMGYMSNPDEDRLMQTAEYQKKMADGIVSGIETYLKKG